MKLRKGDVVIIHWGRNNSAKATVVLAPPDGRTLTLSCERIVYGFAGTVLLLRTREGWVTLNGGEVEIERWLF